MLAMCEFEAFNAGLIVDWHKSLFVGDRPEDEECAKRAGIAFSWAWDFFERPMPEVELKD
jgi:phosphoglycolate phosphatase-like HAD superfamily hydrolase